MNKIEFYADLNRDFQALMAGETSFLATLANTSALLFERLSDVNWAGFYLLEGDTLVLGPFQARLPACVFRLDAAFAVLLWHKIACNAWKMFISSPGILPVMLPVMPKSYCPLH